ncbi:hypothetical protein SPYCW_1596 [Sphingopyxis sp. EG6]|nr:hypothetical protein SPYCW_1596 [Sphingopyxis sp. EG6]
MGTAKMRDNVRMFGRLSMTPDSRRCGALNPKWALTLPALTDKPPARQQYCRDVAALSECQAAKVDFQ